MNPLKLEKLVSVLQSKNIEGCLVSSPYNMRYLSGFRGGTGYLFLTKNRQVLLTDSRYTTQGQQESPDFEVITVSGKEPYDVAIARLLKEEQVSEVGFEDQVMTYESVETLRHKLESQVEISLIPLTGTLDDLRQIKTKEELESIEKAEALGDMAFAYILNEIKPGMTEVEIALLLECYMRKNGAEGLSFDTIVASGENSAMPHAIPGQKKVECGELITMDFGCIVDGYCSDMTRTIVLGKASDKQKEIYDIVLESQLRALEGIRPGVTGKAVDGLARDYIAQKGYGDYFGHGLGHSVGLYIHEEPRLSPKEENVLQPGMVETVEPGIYLPGIGGVRIEDLVEITGNGYKNYTKSPKNLIELI